MRIGVDARALQDERLTGVGEYALRLLDELIKRQDEHHYVLFGNSARQRIHTPADWPADRYTVRMSTLPTKLFNALVVFFGFPKVRQWVGDVDLFFVPNHHYLPRDKKIPMVMTVHDLAFHHFAKTFSWRKRMFHRVVNPKRLYKNATGIIAVSAATAHDVQRSFAVPATKVFTIHSGISASMPTEAERRATRIALQIPERYVFSLSTIEPRKNLITLLEAYTLLRQRGWYSGALVIAGPRGWSSAGFFRALQSHPFARDIHVLDYVTETQKRCLYADADVVLYLSVYEGFGFPPLEAIAQGTPVVTGAHSSISEVAGDAAILVDVYNVEDIAQATHTLLQQPTLQAMLARQRDSVVRRYQWSDCADATLEVFRVIAQTGSHRT